MNESIYYLSIQSTSLAHYMSKALILPSRFYKNRPPDIQNINSDYLVLSKNKFLNNSNCSIGLILANEEVNYLTELKEDSIFLYSKPIATSRVKKVYFIDETQKLKTIDNINRGTAFIPTILSTFIEEKTINRDIIIKDTFKYSPELESKIKTYNNILGGLAFVRHNLDGEYTENYFSIWSHFNNSIEKKNRLAGYDGAFTHKGKVWDKLSPLIYENILEDDVERYAKEEDIYIENSNGIFKYEDINNNTITYKLAILNTYGESQRKKTNDLISDCKKGKIQKEKQEGIALIYGINNGYSSFRNQYDEKTVKFKMDSLLDYYTIESVFQYVINDKKDNGKFEYIDSLFPNEELVLDIGEKAFDLEEYSTNIIKYFKENIFNISVKELLNYIINQFKNTFVKEMDKKDSELKNIKLEIEKLNQKVLIKNNELQEQKGIMDQLSKDRNILNEELKKNNNNINNLNQSIKDKNEHINSLQNDYKNTLEEKNNSINALKKDIETKDNELQKQGNIVDQLNKDKNILNQKLEEKNNINDLKKSIEDKDKSINFLKQEVETKDNELYKQQDIIDQLNKDKDILNQKIEEKNNNINDLKKSIDDNDNKVIFDEEKEKIIIEKTLKLYDKKADELKVIAKEKGIKYTKKLDTVKLILIHKDNRLL